MKLRTGLYIAGGYVVLGLISLAYIVSKGINNGTTFDGITGNESGPVKALEAVGLWPIALYKAVRS